MVIEDHEWPQDSKLEKTVLENEDACHREANGVGDKAYKRALMARHWSTCMICAPEGVRSLRQEDIDLWKAAS